MALHKNRVSIFRFWSDVAIIEICFFSVASYSKSLFDAKWDLLDIGMMLFLCCAWYFTSKSNQLYDEFRVRGFVYEILRTFTNIFFQAIFAGLFLFGINHPYYGREFVVIYVAMLSLLLPIEKFLYKKFLILLRRKGRNLRNLLIIGAGKVGMDFYKLIKSNPHFGYNVVGFLDDDRKPYLNGQYLGTVNALEELFKNNIPQVDEVIVALPNHATETINSIVNIASKEAVRIKIIPDYFQFLSSRGNIDMFATFPMITVRHEPLEEMHSRIIKRLFDICFSLLVLILIFSWLFPLLALLIKLDSKGPVLFKQERWGRQNDKIKCLKFRSMYTHSEDIDENGRYNQAKKGDPRITSIGQFLRKSSLDEFPQFINVLLGSMSVVGPRPHPIPLNIESRDTIDNYLVRHLVKPGITGWAQVNGLRGETPDISLMQTRIEYDIWYIENWDLKLDVKIVAMTIGNMLFGDKNAF